MARVMDVALRIVERPWQWGHADCCTFACDVFDEVYGIDPMADLRGIYSSLSGSLRLIRARGGMRANVRRTLQEAGLVPCTPSEGALGVALNPAGQEVAAICAQPGVWLIRTTTGLTSRPTAYEVHHLAGASCPKQ